MSCTSRERQSEDGVGRLPDWAFGGFERPENVNPVISPIDNTWFYCPLTEDSVAWESNDTFNPAATIYDEKIVVLYRAEDKSGIGIGRRTSRLGYATSVDGVTFQRRSTPVFIRTTICKRVLNGQEVAKIRGLLLLLTGYML